MQSTFYIIVLFFLLLLTSLLVEKAVWLCNYQISNLIKNGFFCCCCFFFTNTNSKAVIVLAFEKSTVNVTSWSMCHCLSASEMFRIPGSRAYSLARCTELHNWWEFAARLTPSEWLVHLVARGRLSIKFIKVLRIRYFYLQIEFSLSTLVHLILFICC